MFELFKNKKNFAILTTSLCFAISFLSPRIIYAADVSAAIFSIHIDEMTIKKGYEIKSFNNKMQIAIFPNVLKKPARIQIKDRNRILAIENGLKFSIETAEVTDADITASTTNALALFETAPKGWEINSAIYEFDILNKEAFSGEKPLIVTLKPERETNQWQKIFYWDNTKGQWVALPSMISYKDYKISALIHLSYARVAVFENKDILCNGSASWYKYKGCNCAASPDYPKGTKLKVTAAHNKKSVIVEVNDFGPDRSIFPDRVIDLDIDAFEKLANKRAGVIDVKVEPVKEIFSYAFQKAEHPAAPPPQIESKYAIIIDEPTGEIFYKKNESSKVPIASITKLMTANIFLDLFSNLQDEQNWDKAVKYVKEDDLEGARLYVQGGETMLIEDLFYSMLVGSANNATQALVRNSGMGADEFIAAMNAKAKEWNLNDTIFKEPAGLDPGNMSTAFDLAVMARKIFQNFTMLEATTARQYAFKTLNTGKQHLIKNTNELLLDTDLYITGGKTGFLNEAGYCLILKAKNRDNGKEIIGVVLGAKSSKERFEDMKNLIAWGLGD